MLVFAVETSCDETSVCILNDSKKILSHIIYSQEEHKGFGVSGFMMFCSIMTKLRDLRK